MLIPVWTCLSAISRVVWAWPDPLPTGLNGDGKNVQILWWVELDRLHSMTRAHPPLADHSSNYNSCIFMVKLRNSFLRKQKHQQCDEMLSTFMKNTTVNKLKNKIINYSPLFKCLQL